MRKLVFILALLCCTSQVMAQCPTFKSDLSGQCLFVNAGGIKRTVGPIQFQGGFPLQFAAPDTLIFGAQVQGLCVTLNNVTKISWDVFMLGTLTQSFFGTLTRPPSGPITASGTFSANNSKWDATVGPCSPKAPPPSVACIQCGEDLKACRADADTPQQRKLCWDNNTKCRDKNHC